MYFGVRDLVFDRILSVLASLIWLWSLIVIILVKKKDSVSPEIIRLRKRVMGLNIALVCVTLYRFYSIHSLYYLRISLMYFRIVGLPMIVLAVLCIADSIRLFKARSQAQQFGRQDYQQQNYIPHQQTQPAPRQQSAKCPHCGVEIEAGSYFCVHCGKKI